MKLRTFEDKSYNPKRNAQMNLIGRTHYVDDWTLRYFHARIVASGTECSGLIFWIIESHAVDMDNTQREFRFVVFDVGGHVLERAENGSGYRTHNQARKALDAYLATIDAESLTHAAIKREVSWLEREGEWLKTHMERNQKSAA
jgi:hypothetical protein